MDQIKPADDGLHETFLKLLSYLLNNIQNLGEILPALVGSTLSSSTSLRR